MAHITINQYLQQVGFARDLSFLTAGVDPGAGSDRACLGVGICGCL